MDFFDTEFYYAICNMGIRGGWGYPRWWDNIIAPIWVLSAMILLLPAAYIRLKHHVGKDDVSKAKSYLYAAIAVLTVTILNSIYVLAFHHSLT